MEFFHNISFIKEKHTSYIQQNLWLVFFWRITPFSKHIIRPTFWRQSTIFLLQRAWGVENEIVVVAAPDVDDSHSFLSLPLYNENTYKIFQSCVCDHIVMFSIYFYEFSSFFFFYSRFLCLFSYCKFMRFLFDTIYKRRDGRNWICHMIYLVDADSRDDNFY